MSRCFREALVNAGVDPGEVAYINAHGPGTAACDAAEAQILDELFPDAHGIYSVKPLVGHCQSAAAGVETLATLYAHRNRVYSGAAPGGARAPPAGGRAERPSVPGMTVKSSIGMGGYNTVRGDGRARPDLRPR